MQMSDTMWFMVEFDKDDIEQYRNMLDIDDVERIVWELTGGIAKTVEQLPRKRLVSMRVGDD